MHVVYAFNLPIATILPSRGIKYAADPIFQSTRSPINSHQIQSITFFFIMKNIVWTCKRGNDLIPYPFMLSKMIENAFQNITNGKVKRFEINKDNFIKFDRDNRFFEHNLFANEQRAVYRVILWAFCGKEVKEWKLFSLKECIQIEDTFNGKSGNKDFVIRDRGIIHFNSLPNTSSHFLFSPFGANKFGIVRRGGLPHQDDKIAIVAMAKSDTESKKISIAEPIEICKEENTQKQTDNVDENAMDKDFEQISNKAQSIQNMKNKQKQTFDQKVQTEINSNFQHQNTEIGKQKITNFQSTKKRQSKRNIGTQSINDAKAQKKKRRRRRTLHFHYNGDSDTRIESELRQNFNNLMIERTDHQHKYLEHRMSAKSQYFIQQKRVQNKEKKLRQSMNEYGSYQNEMMQRAEEEMYEKQRVLRSINYKMKRMTNTKSDRSDLHQLQSEIELMRHNIARRQKHHSVIKNINKLSRSSIMIDAGLMNDKMTKHRKTMN